MGFQGIHIKGQISGNADLVVDGSVDGPIELPDGQLTVGVSGQIAGDVVARDAIIHGKVNGNLRVRDRLEIKFDGSIVGNVTSGRIFIEEGAFFKGSIESGPEDLRRPDLRNPNVPWQLPQAARKIPKIGNEPVGPAESDARNLTGNRLICIYSSCNISQSAGGKSMCQKRGAGLVNSTATSFGDG